MDRDGRRHALRVLSAEEVELLVHELLVAKHAQDGVSVRKLRPPDGGADSLVLGEGDHTVEVVQVKHYPDKIHWAHCERSLDQAVRSWAPPVVTFAFTRDFTVRQQKTFAERLGGRHPGLRVKSLTLSDLERLMASHPHVAARFFGPDAHSMAEVVARATRMGGTQLETGRDLIARAHELASFGDELDPKFDYQHTAGAITAPTPTFDKVPFMSVEVAGERRRVRVDTWPRDEAEVELPAIQFTSDEVKDRVRENLAAGDPAVIHEGVRVVLQTAPRLVKDLVDGNVEMTEGTFLPGEPIDLHLSVETPKEVVERDFTLYPVPPVEPNDHLAYASLQDGLWLELDLHLPEPPTVNVGLNFAARFGSDAATNADLAAWMIAMLDHERVVMVAPALLPPQGLSTRLGDCDRETFGELEFRRELYTDLAFIEHSLAITLPIPGEVEEEDVQIIGTVAEILRSGKGTATMRESRSVVPAEDLARFATDDIRATVYRQVCFELWGQTLDLGIGEYTTPKLKLASLRPLSDSSEAEAELVLVPAESDQMIFTLVGDGARMSSARGGQLLDPQP